jgi:hypothetical protein
MVVSIILPLRSKWHGDGKSELPKSQFNGERRYSTPTSEVHNLNLYLEIDPINALVVTNLGVPDRPVNGRWPETGLWEINGDLLEADFGPVSTIMSRRLDTFHQIILLKPLSSFVVLSSKLLPVVQFPNETTWYFNTSRFRTGLPPFFPVGIDVRSGR